MGSSRMLASRMRTASRRRAASWARHPRCATRNFRFLRPLQAVHVAHERGASCGAEEKIRADLSEGKIPPILTNRAKDRTSEELDECRKRDQFHARDDLTNSSRVRVTTLRSWPHLARYVSLDIVLVTSEDGETRTINPSLGSLARIGPRFSASRPQAAFNRQTAPACFLH